MELIESEEKKNMEEQRMICIQKMCIIEKLNMFTELSRCFAFSPRIDTFMSACWSAAGHIF